MAMTTSVLKVNGMAQLPTNPLSVAMSFLEPQEVAQAERVCTSWKRVIGSPDQRVWKGICARDNIPVVSEDVRLLKEDTVLDTHQAPSGGFTPQILGCIAEYAADYKEEAAVLHARILLDTTTWYINDRGLTSFSKRCFDWGNSEIEPFVMARLSYKTYRTGMDEEDMPQNVPSSVKNFPRDLPLRLFMDREENYLDTGRKIQLVFASRRMILTCKHRREFCDGREFNSFKTALEERVRISLNCQFMTSEALKTAMTLAKAAPDWIVVKEKKKSE